MFVCNETNEVCIAGGEVLSLTPRPNEKLTLEDGEKFHLKVKEYNNRRRELLLKNTSIDDWSDRDFSETGIWTFINPLQFNGEAINLKHCVYITDFFSSSFRAIDRQGNEIRIYKNDHEITGDDVTLINNQMAGLALRPNLLSSVPSSNPKCPLDSEFYSKVMEIALPSLVMDVVDRIKARGHIEIPVLNHYDFKFCRFNSHGLEYKKTGLFATTKQYSWHEISIRNVAIEMIPNVKMVRMDLHSSHDIEPHFSLDDSIINPVFANANQITAQKEKANGLFKAVIPAFLHYMKSKGH